MHPPATATRARLPGAVVLLGLVSLLMDLSSEAIHSLLPLLLVGPLGADIAMVGWIEGLAEATASFTRIASGSLSDRWARRRPLMLAGYGLAALTKPAFALALWPVHVLAARCADRVGKGIRGAPRDALIADITPPGKRGAAYGLRQALDTVGAVLGPLAAVAGLLAWPGALRRVLAWAAVPALLAFGLLWLVREPARAATPAPSGAHRSRPAGVATPLGAACRRVITVGGLLALARFSEAFLLLRGQQAGLSMAMVPLVLVAMNVAYAALAWPAGHWADRHDARRLLAAGLVLLALADGALAARGPPVLLWCGAALWGLHMAMTQGLLSRLLANAAPPTARGRAFGWFNLVTGFATLAASVVAGWLWDHAGSGASFLLGAALSVAALGCLPLLRR